jgi:hypothetical protein
MSFAGLISGVLGGAAKGYGEYAGSELKKQQELDLRQQLLEAETEKKLRIDEIKRTRDIEDIGRRHEAEAAAAPIAAKGRVAGEVAALEAADAAGLPEKKAAYKGRELEAGRDNVKLQSRIEAEGEVEKTSTPGYLKAASDKARAGHVESASSAASAEATRFALQQQRQLASLRGQLSKLPEGDPQRAVLERQIKDLTGTMSNKSYGDMVTAAGHYRLMAQNLRKDAEMATSDAERGEILRRANSYEQEADAILQTTKDRRLGGGASKPAAAAPAKGGPREGERGTSKSGKPIVFTNGQWVYE